MDKLFKIRTVEGTYFIWAMNKDWAEEYFYREYPTFPPGEITEVKDKRVIAEGDFK